jgi:hypothetical protein
MLWLQAYFVGDKTGRIHGTVVDASDRKPLSGIIVKILNTPHKHITDNNGRFEFNDLIPGKYELVFNSVWYHPLKLENIEVKTDEPTILKESLLIQEFEETILKDVSIKNKCSIRSNMKVVKPDPGINYRILVIEPDSTIYYKLLVIDPWRRIE